MTIEQANEYFSSLPEGFAPAEELSAALTADARKVQFVGVAGTAGKTAAAGLLAAILREAAFHTGFYRAGCEPLSARIAIGGVSVDPVLFCQAAEALSAAKPLPRAAAELAAAACCFGAADCKLAVVELPDAGLAAALPSMPVCAVTAIGPDGVSRSVERLAALAAGVMRKGAVCVTAPEQPKAVLSELVVAAAKAECELVVPDAEDITFLEAEKFTSRVDYGGYTAPLAFLGRHAAGNAAVAVELALALWRKGFEIPDEAILAGLAAEAPHHPRRLPYPPAGRSPSARPQYGQGAPHERCHRPDRRGGRRGLLFRAGKRPDPRGTEEGQGDDARHE